MRVHGERVCARVQGVSGRGAVGDVCGCANGVSARAGALRAPINARVRAYVRGLCAHTRVFVFARRVCACAGSVPLRVGARCACARAPRACVRVRGAGGAVRGCTECARCGLRTRARGAGARAGGACARRASWPRRRHGELEGERLGRSWRQEARTRERGTQHRGAGTQGPPPLLGQWVTAAGPRSPALHGVHCAGGGGRRHGRGERWAQQRGRSPWGERGCCGLAPARQSLVCGASL